MNPVVVLAGIIVLSVLFLILCAIFGWDKGVLQNMSLRSRAHHLPLRCSHDRHCGRSGAALTTSADARHEKQFQLGKEILSLWLGVFGTIVGFYFGAEIGKGAEETLRILPVHLSSDTVAPNTKFKFTTVVSGGEPPYQFGVGFGPGTGGNDGARRRGRLDRNGGHRGAVSGQQGKNGSSGTSGFRRQWPYAGSSPRRSRSNLHRDKLLPSRKAATTRLNSSGTSS
jgi:hypothetical protein